MVQELEEEDKVDVAEILLEEGANVNASRFVRNYPIIIGNYILYYDHSSFSAIILTSMQYRVDGRRFIMFRVSPWQDCC